jgi:DnaJ-class molecular chaperone
MRLEEAAAVLGVHPDTPIETLKQTYRRLALAWHPDKVNTSIPEMLVYKSITIV